MTSIDVQISGCVVRVSIEKIEDGLYLARVAGRPDVQAYGVNEVQAAAKAAQRASYAMNIDGDVQAA